MNTRRKFGNRYPWGRWFRKGRFRLTEGRDYTCRPYGMAQMVRTQASKCRLRVRVTIGLDDVISVAVVGRLPAKQESSRT